MEERRRWSGGGGERGGGEREARNSLVLVAELLSFIRLLVADFSHVCTRTLNVTLDID